MFVNTLEQLSQYTTIVADTGELSAIARLRPQDATTNPSLVTASFMNSREDILQELPLVSSSCSDIDTIIDELTVALGVRILSYIKGRISTEVNPKWSYDTQKTVANALELIESYTKKGIDTKRVLIKIAATWQGIQAAINEISVATELQADFFAGLWANRTNQRQMIIEPGDIEAAISAAEAVGDDNIQRRTQGHVNQESFTHGSSAQRKEWFMKGYRAQSIRQGNTFEVLLR